MINIYRAGKKAFCEREQLKIMEAAGWTTDANAMKAKMEVKTPETTKTAETGKETTKTT